MLGVILKSDALTGLFNLVSINQTDWRTIPACPSHSNKPLKERVVSFVNRSSIRSYFENLCFDVCFAMYLCMGLFGTFDLRMGLHVRRVLKCEFAFDKFDHSEVTLHG